VGWKIVRDENESWCKAHDVSGQWRKAELPEYGLARKLIEESAEYMESMQTDELYDVLDVVTELIKLTDSDGKAARRHEEKVKLHGRFSQHIEWCPVPAQHENNDRR
jgi:predicted house-cleaning noncanonical NTP pyrophosphatase (MazG superfamily)